MNAQRLFLLPILTAALLTGVACDGCNEQPAPEGDGNTLPANNDPRDGEDEDPQPEPRVLRYEGSSPVQVYYGQSTTLSFSLHTRGGGKVTGEPVRYTLSSTSAGNLNVTESNTDANGIARVTFTGGSGDADVILTAANELAENEEAVAIQVRVNPFGTLNVSVSSTTRITTNNAELLVFTGPANNVPPCSVLNSAINVPTASFAADFNVVPGSRMFNEQPHGQSVTVLASGFNAAGDLIGLGCADGATIAGGATTNVNVVIEQLPSVVEGDYDALLNVNLGNALPEPYDGYIDTVTGLLSDPAGYATYQALVQVDEQYGFSFIYWDPDGDGNEELPSFQEVQDNSNQFGTWVLARSILEQMMIDQFGEDYTTVTTIGGDLRSAVTAFEIGARFSFTKVAGLEDTYSVSEQWNDVVFNWGLGCDEGDLGCSRRPVQLENTDYAPVATTYQAGIDHQPLQTESERFAVVTEPHLFALRYGAIIMIAMNEVVFPNLPAGVAGNSLEEVMGNLIDCADVGVAIADAIGFLDASLYSGLCDLGLGFLADYVEGQVLQLEAGSGNPELSPKEQDGALGGGTFYLVDRNHDIATEVLNEIEMQVQWNDEETGQNEDILAPITGDGRLAATGCIADSECDTGSSCHAVPHYLKIQSVEQTCSRSLGQSLGEDNCTADIQCASGLCVRAQGAATNAPGTCYAACTEDNDCGLGTCQADAASLNLDTVMAGLGYATTASCMP
jgi:hypothetical protein